MGVNIGQMFKCIPTISENAEQPPLAAVSVGQEAVRSRFLTTQVPP